MCGRLPDKVPAFFKQKPQLNLFPDSDARQFFRPAFICRLRLGQFPQLSHGTHPMSNQFTDQEHLQLRKELVDRGRIVRELMALAPPVGVRFESENLFKNRRENAADDVFWYCSGGNGGQQRMPDEISPYDGNLRDDLFQEKVSKFSSREISRSAREQKMGSMGYAEVMLAACSKKTHYPPRWSQLHELKSQRICAADEDTGEIQTASD